MLGCLWLSFADASLGADAEPGGQDAKARAEQVLRHMTDFYKDLKGVSVELKKVAYRYGHWRINPEFTEDTFAVPRRNRTPTARPGP
jgi:hypothetical protein